MVIKATTLEIDVEDIRHSLKVSAQIGGGMVGGDGDDSDQRLKSITLQAAPTLSRQWSGYSMADRL